MSRLLFFHDFTSPYCRLALDTVSEAADRAGLEVRPVPFELWPAPTPVPPADESELLDEFETALGMAGEWGVQLRRPTTIPRTRKAHEAVAFALDHGGVMALIRGIYRAFWTDGRDIGRIDVLSEIAGDVGLDREALHVALGLDQYEVDVVREEHAAQGADIHGVPVVQLGSVRAAGLMSSAELAAWIRENR